MERQPDISISGMGKMNGGIFNHVDISGLGTIVGDVMAERIAISGKGTIEGDAKAARKIDISGMGKIEGNVDCEVVSTSGTGNIDGNLQCHTAESSGNLKVGGSAKVVELATDGRCRIDGQLKAEKIVSRGYLSVGVDVEAEEFYSQGSFTVEGLINANKIDIEIYGFCKAKEIGGEEIRVRNRHVNLAIVSKLLSSFFGNGREFDNLTSDLIEGTEVSLEYTHARTVRGDRVIIGRNCQIDEVEYTDTLEIDPSASVKQSTKIIAPKE